MKRFGSTRQLGLALALLTVPFAPAAALNCNSGNLGQADLNACAGNAFHKADALLNARYKQIIACLKDKAQPLVAAQRAWIAFRDAECKFQGSASEGGSIQPMVVGECLKTVTAQRAKELDYYLTCEEGDASCPTLGCGFRK